MDCFLSFHFSVMEKLPPTSYVRMVDIWLICGQLIPFVEVMLLTLMELYNETDTINHHGHPRKVAPDSTTTTTTIQVSSASLKSEGNKNGEYEENVSHCFVWCFINFHSCFSGY